uniref:Uncharacterized protein n=1 Tax=Biomphalaria glabrata TaxID=6526 RepID=A0A2C9LQQ2_BIOGL
MIKSNMIKAACAIALIAIIFNIVAILTPNWSENKVASSGLWKACAKTIPICGEYDYMADIKDRKVKIFATAAFAIIGLLCSLVGFAFSVMIVLENKSDYNSYKIVWGTLFAADYLKYLRSCCDNVHPQFLPLVYKCDRCLETQQKRQGHLLSSRPRLV